MDQETVDEFEDRVLNKRAAKLHFRMRKMYEDTSSLTYSDLARRKDIKKDAAQKFYSLLVLQKVTFVLTESQLLFTFPSVPVPRS